MPLPEPRATSRSQTNEGAPPDPGPGTAQAPIEVQDSQDLRRDLMTEFPSPDEEDDMGVEGELSVEELSLALARAQGEVPTALPQPTTGSSTEVPIKALVKASHKKQAEGKEPPQQKKGKKG